MVRQHETYVLAEGTFRVVLTRSGRVFAAIELEESALGPLHLAFEIGVPLTFQTGSLIGKIARGVEHAGRDIGHGFEQAGRDLGHVAEGTFDATAKVSTTLARPAFNIVRDAAAGGAHLLGQAPLVPEHERKRIEAASRVMMRARLREADDLAHHFSTLAVEWRTVADQPHPPQIGLRDVQKGPDEALSSRHPARFHGSDDLERIG